MFGFKKKAGDATAAPEQAPAAVAAAGGAAQYGGFWIRSLALSVDSTILFLASIVIAVGFSMLGAELAMIGGLIAVLIQLLYFPLMHASARQATIGKQMLGLKVAHAQTGDRISIPRALARDVLGKIISSVVMGLGYLIAAFTPRKQGLHDYVASTVVVREGEAHIARAFIVSIAGILIPAIAIPIFFAGMFAGLMGAVMGGMMGGMMGEPVKPPPVQAPAQRTQAKPPAVQNTQQVAGANQTAPGAQAKGDAAPAIAGAASSPAMPASAAGDPEEAYAKLHAATLAGDVIEMRRSATAAKRTELAAMPKAQLTALVNTIGSMMPQEYKVTRKSIAPDGKTATLLASGTSEFGKQEVHGAVNLVLEDGEWRVGEWSWTTEKTDKPKVAASAAVLPETKTAGKAKTATVAAVGAVGDKEKSSGPAPSAEERKRAREEAARLAEQKRAAAEKLRVEQFNARCSFKPVMTDAEIDQCRPARR